MMKKISELTDRIRDVLPEWVNEAFTHLSNEEKLAAFDRVIEELVGSYSWHLNKGMKPATNMSPIGPGQCRHLLMEMARAVANHRRQGVKNTLAELKPLTKVIFEALAEAMQERDARQVFVDGEPAWALYERDVLLQLVNDERMKRGLEAVDWREIQKLEQYNLGHSDYHSKLALHCAELALGLTRK